MIGWLFLVLSVYGALYTLNAFVPWRRGRLGFVWGFVSSWITIEAAIVHLVWQVALAGVFVALGALDNWAGRVGLAVSVASWIGLVVLFAQGRRTGRVIDAALGDLGAGVVARRYRRSLVRHTRRVEYARAGGRRLRLDVFEPSDVRAPGEKRPAIVQIHGGGWVLGFKERQALPLMRHLAANGWVVFNIDYRLSPAATWPDHLVDCKTAVAWVREHAEDYGIDPSFVAVTGGSAGGHLAALLGLTADDPRYQRSAPDADTSVQAVVPFYGVFDWTNRTGQFGPELLADILEPLVVKAFLDEAPETYAEASPILLVERAGAAGAAVDIPPFLVVHGDRDTLAPVADARVFVHALGQVSANPVLYLELAGAQHAFDAFRSPRTDRVVLAVHRFLTECWDRHRDGVPAAPHDR